MELGELLFMLAQKIIGHAESEFNIYRLPATLRPLVMESVKSHYMTAAYDHMIAVKLSEQEVAQDNQKPEADAPKKTRSGTGLDELKKSLDADFRRGDG